MTPSPAVRAAERLPAPLLPLPSVPSPPLPSLLPSASSSPASGARAARSQALIARPSPRAPRARIALGEWMRPWGGLTSCPPVAREQWPAEALAGAAEKETRGARGRGAREREGEKSELRRRERRAERKESCERSHFFLPKISSGRRVFLEETRGQRTSRGGEAARGREAARRAAPAPDPGGARRYCWRRSFVSWWVGDDPVRGLLRLPAGVSARPRHPSYRAAVLAELQTCLFGVFHTRCGNRSQKEFLLFFFWPQFHIVLLSPSLHHTLVRGLGDRGTGRRLRAEMAGLVAADRREGRGEEGELVAPVCAAELVRREGWLRAPSCSGPPVGGNFPRA